jgi:hypothetical protein
MHISDPLPRNIHDAKALHVTGLNELLDNENTIGDKGYLGTGILTRIVNHLAEAPRLAQRIQRSGQQNPLCDRTRDLSLQDLAVHAHRLPQTQAHLRHSIRRHPNAALLHATFYISFLGGIHLTGLG